MIFRGPLTLKVPWLGSGFIEKRFCLGMHGVGLGATSATAMLSSCERYPSVIYVTV